MINYIEGSLTHGYWNMTFSWKLHLIIFWATIGAVGLAALAVGWNATSGLTDEESSYLLYEPAFLILMVVLGLTLVVGSHQIAKIEERMGEVEDGVVTWAVKRGWEKPAMSDDLKDWIIQMKDTESHGPKSKGDVRNLLDEYDLFLESRNNAWKKLLGPVLQLLFLLTITSAAVPSAYWFLRVNPNINTITAIFVLGGSIVAVFYALSALMLLYPKVKAG
jgi:hypothetical protein